MKTELDILYGKTNMRDALECLGMKEEIIQQTLSGYLSSSKYFYLSVMAKRMAYNKLLRLGEIHSDDIFNIGMNAYSEMTTNRLGDIGFKGEDGYGYTNNGWQKMI